MRPTRALLFAFLLVSAGCEIRPLDPVTGKAIIEDAQQAFDAASFVEENWESRIIPVIEDEAVDLAALLMELHQNREAASVKYGYREGSGPFNFRVRGSGRVIRVDTTSRAGALTVELPDRTATVLLQIGPVIRGTSLRDALPFITFDQFVNQLEYAKVSNAMHDRLVDSVLSDINFGTLLNREVGFIGVFTLRDLNAIMITPVEISVEGAE